MKNGLSSGPESALRKLDSLLPTEANDLRDGLLHEFLGTAERQFFLAALAATNGSVTEIANRIGLSRSTVFKRMNDLGITRRSYGSSDVGELELNPRLPNIGASP